MFGLGAEINDTKDLCAQAKHAREDILQGSQKRTKGLMAARNDDAISHLCQALRIGLQCENRYALSKSVGLLKQLGVDPESCLK